MSGQGPLWRGIIWIERFLPNPPRAVPEPSAAARRRAALVPQLVLLVVAVAPLVRHWRAFGEVLIEHRVLMEQLTLVVAGCIVVAAIGVGVKAWRDAQEAR